MAETSIDRLTLDIVVNNDNATRRINNITKAIEKLNTAMGKSGNIDKVLDKINNVSPTSTRGGSTSKGGSNKTNKNLNIFATLGKWNYMINMARYYGRSLANIVQLSMDYVETQNLWQVANRNNLEMAEQFIQKMNKAYGVSEATLMNYQAIFKNMLSALGDLSDEISSGLSMQLTQMALDFSSLYNVTIPSAMQKFQAVLSGQVRPIRSVSGYDITENTIFDLYAGAGGEKTMRQLSQIEKRLLRIVAVFDQMGATGATGDMAKTIESASNQARIMSEQAKETLTWTGQLVLMWMDSVGLLQHINAFLITMKEIMRAIAYDMGYSEKNFLDGLVTSAEDAGEAVDDIQGKLLSFDKFESLNSNKSNVLGIDQTVLDLLEKINYESEQFTMEAQEIANGWLNALGLVDKNGDGIVEITEKTRELLDTLKTIGVVLGTLMGMKLISKITLLTGGISGITSSFKGLKDAFDLVTLGKEVGKTFTYMDAQALGIGKSAFNLATIFKSLFSPLGITTMLIGTLYATNEDFRESINRLLQSFAPLFNTLSNLLGDLLEPLVGTTGSLLDLIAPIATFIVNNLIVSLNQLFVALVPIMYVLEAIVKLIQTGLEGMRAFATWDWKGFGKNMKDIWSNWNSTDFAKSSWKNYTSSFGNLVPAYATGGFPEDGLFFANSGELVGQFSNGRTAVANNDQIVTGITQGVYSAMMAYNAQTRGQGGSGDVYLDGTKVGRVVAKGSHSEMVRVGLIKANS